MQGGDALNDFSAQQRADIEALLAPSGQQGEILQAQPVGLIRRAARFALRFCALAVVAVIGWHLFSLASMPDAPFDAVHAPVALTVATGLAAILFLLWFDGKLRRLPLLLVGAALLAICGLSMRWVDSSRSGIREHWAGIERSRIALPGDLCYRIDVASFALRGAGRTRLFVYPRGYWPGAFDEAAFKSYFFSDLRMRTGVDGWTCIDRG